MATAEKKVKEDYDVLMTISKVEAQTLRNLLGGSCTDLEKAGLYSIFCALKGVTEQADDRYQYMVQPRS